MEGNKKLCTAKYCLRHTVSAILMIHFECLSSISMTDRGVYIKS